MESKVINVISLHTEIAQKLHALYPSTTLCEQYAWWLLQAIMRSTQTDLLAQRFINIDKAQQHEIDRWLHAMINEQMPIQYLLGSVPFGDLEILVEPPVIIPRPETEEWCLDLADQLKQIPGELTLLDLCSGTGCIALTLAKTLPHARVYACDISPAAIALGQKNAWHNHVENVTFINSDLFKELPSDLRFDCIVSNPPYITQEEWAHVEDSVTRWEDPHGLVTDDDGLAVIKQLIAQAPHYLKKNHAMLEARIAQLIIEIGYKQGEHVKALMLAHGFGEVSVRKDLEKKDRIVQGRVYSYEDTTSNSK